MHRGYKRIQQHKPVDSDTTERIILEARQSLSGRGREISHGITKRAGENLLDT
ncbi:MAG: hypothetical protein ACI4GB_00005 [Acutalibacteraceae bacterium]